MSKKWDWHSIKAELHRRGMTLTRLAVMNGLDPSACRVVASRTHRKAEAAIATFLDVQPVELWPDRYPARTTRILSSKYDDAAASQKSTVGAGMGRAA